jgi:hypothetical protein
MTEDQEATIRSPCRHSMTEDQEATIRSPCRHSMTEDQEATIRIYTRGISSVLAGQVPLHLLAKLVGRARGQTPVNRTLHTFHTIPSQQPNTCSVPPHARCMGHKPDFFIKRKSRDQVLHPLSNSKRWVAERKPRRYVARQAAPCVSVGEIRARVGNRSQKQDGQHGGASTGGVATNVRLIRMIMT